MPSETLRSLAAHAQQSAAPAVTAQVMALVVVADPSLRDSLRRAFSALPLARSGRTWRRPREVLSLAEAGALLGGRTPADLGLAPRN